MSVALADDFKTIDGKEYKNATVTGVEPDGILLKTKSGISKVYFVELPKDVQERFHYDAAKGSEFTTLQQGATEESNAAVAIQQQEEAQERQRRAAESARQQQHIEEQQRQADANLARQEQQWSQARHRHTHQQQQNATARQAAERERQRQIAGALASQRAQEDQLIQREYQRNAENMQRKSEQSRLASEKEWQQMRQRQDQWVQQDRVENARQQLQMDQMAHPWYNKQNQIQIDRENLRREEFLLKQQKQQQR
jgi:hypothetical protein